MGRPALAQILDQTAAFAQKHTRDDLVERLGSAKERLMDPSIRVLVVGEYKKGKSSLVNGLLALPVAPVDDDIATCVPTVVRYGEEAKATVVLEPSNGEPPPRRDIPVNELPAYVSEA